MEMSKSRDREIIQTSFNMNDKFEKQLYDYVKAQGVASKFIKRLVYDHMNGIQQTPSVPTQHVMVPVLNEKQQAAIDNIDV
jgi:hypothetical protein